MIFAVFFFLVLLVMMVHSAVVIAAEVDTDAEADAVVFTAAIAFLSTLHPKILPIKKKLRCSVWCNFEDI